MNPLLRMAVGDSQLNSVHVSVFRSLLQKERQQREDAERQRLEMEERLRRYEAECEEAREGVHHVHHFITFSKAS